MTIIFVENNHILPKDIINATKKYFFICLFIVKREKDMIEKIISFMYKDNMLIKKEKDPSVFHKVDLL